MNYKFTTMYCKNISVFLILFFLAGCASSQTCDVLSIKKNNALKTEMTFKCHGTGQIIEIVLDELEANKLSRLPEVASEVQIKTK